MRLHIKSQFGADFRRLSIVIGTGLPYPTLEDFTELIHKTHKLEPQQQSSTTLAYQDKDGSCLPLTNDDNLRRALDVKQMVLRVVVRNKGESYEEQFGYGLTQKSIEIKKKQTVSISAPQEFRRVSSILDADTLPLELRRVQLCKNYSNKPLGFYIRDGTAVYWSPQGPIMTKGIFISRLLPQGLAASTNILNVNDEILEVADKTLDQVTDIMLANSQNLILTTRPSRNGEFHSTPPPYGMPPPGYQPLHPYPVVVPFDPHYGQFYNPYHGYEPVNDEKNGFHTPLNTFSRHSTYRLSSEKVSHRTPPENITTPARRPMSMHPGWLYPSTPYGMGY